MTGRCRYPNKLADDLWAREDVFSTGLGFGFAIPHTKSEHIEQSAIVVCAVWPSQLNGAMNKLNSLLC